jgi:hypothetical protein
MERTKMWPLMSGLWKTRRARRAAVSAIASLVERSRNRLDGIPERIWLDPYMVGFLVMLITLLAKREVDALDSQALGLAQCEAWTEITGMKSDLIGAEVIHLSATGHKTFELGCKDAVAFDLALHGTSTTGVFDLGSGMIDDTLSACVNNPARTIIENQDILTLWDHYFETGMAMHAGARGSAYEATGA